MVRSKPGPGGRGARCVQTEAASNGRAAPAYSVRRGRASAKEGARRVATRGLRGLQGGHVASFLVVGSSPARAAVAPRGARAMFRRAGGATRGALARFGHAAPSPRAEHGQRRLAALSPRAERGRRSAALAAPRAEHGRGSATPCRRRARRAGAETPRCAAPRAPAQGVLPAHYGRLAHPIRLNPLDLKRLKVAGERRIWHRSSERYRPTGQDGRPRIRRST